MPELIINEVEKLEPGGIYALRINSDEYPSEQISAMAEGIGRYLRAHNIKILVLDNNCEFMGPKDLSDVFVRVKKDPPRTGWNYDDLDED